MVSLTYDRGDKFQPNNLQELQPGFRTGSWATYYLTNLMYKDFKSFIVSRMTILEIHQLYAIYDHSEV